jgi:hypothetical protein
MTRCCVIRQMTWVAVNLLVVGACGADGEANPSGGLGGNDASAPTGGSGGVGGTTGAGGTTPNGGTTGAGGRGAGGTSSFGGNAGGTTDAGSGGASGVGGSGTGGASGVGGSGTGGLGTGGSGTGGLGTGGSGGSGTGGTGGSGTGGSCMDVAGSSSLGNAYPCNNSTSGYDALVTNNNGTWTVRRSGNTVHTGTDMAAAIQAGINSLSSGRTSKQSVLVQGSGSMSADARISVTSYTILNVCGTMNVTGSGTGDKAPIYARGQQYIDIPNVTITGAPLYGMFFRDVDNLHIGRADLRVTSGLGIRIDNHGRANRADKVDNIQIDYAYVQGTGAHGVETYGANNVIIGKVVARNTGYSGLLLNDSTNAEVGCVNADGAGTGTGYAAFRMANDNGAINGSHATTNIHVGEVIARRGGRGIFCVTRSGGAVIDRVDIANTGNNSILIQNCHNVTIAANQGTVAGPGDIRLGFDSSGCASCANSSNIRIQNLTVTGATIREDPCADNSTFSNITLMGGATMNVCN